MLKTSESWIFALRLGNHEQRDSETKYTYKLVAFDPGNAGYGVSESQILQTFSRVACPPTPLYKSIGADSPLVSPVTWRLMFSSKKRTPYLDQTRDDIESGWSRSLNAEETIWKEIKGASTLGARALVPEYDTRWALIWTHIFWSARARIRARCRCPSTRSRPWLGHRDWLRNLGEKSLI